LPSTLSRQNSANVVPVSEDLAVLHSEDGNATRQLKREDERQKLFQKISNKVLDIPTGYRKVEVLIIRWDKKIDEFKGHDGEVSHAIANQSEHVTYVSPIWERLRGYVPYLLWASATTAAWRVSKTTVAHSSISTIMSSPTYGHTMERIIF
jgi:ABC-type cobalt transport system substrate-binding protein